MAVTREFAEGRHQEEAREAEEEPVTLSPAAQEELAQVQADLPLLEGELRAAVAAYVERKPWFDVWRTKDPEAREAEMAMIRGVGRLQEEIRAAQSRIAFLSRDR